VIYKRAAGAKGAFGSGRTESEAKSDDPRSKREQSVLQPAAAASTPDPLGEIRSSYSRD
jgi:hypothetical protein